MPCLSERETSWQQMSNNNQTLTFDAMKGCQKVSLEALKKLLALQLHQESWMRFSLELQFEKLLRHKMELTRQLLKLLQDQTHF